jgi:hypothetical protein
MLRRIPATPLVCLVIVMSSAFLAQAWAETPEESLDIIMNPPKGTSAPKPETYRAKPRYGVKSARAVAPHPAFYGPRRITKVKPPKYCDPICYRLPCFLPLPGPKQWDMSVQVLFAKIRGTVAWPRYHPYYSSYWGYDNEVDFSDMLGLPAHDVLLEFTAQYQFRWNWAIRYSVLGDEFNGGLDYYNYATSYYQKWFGPLQLNTYQGLHSKWTHLYHRLGLVYDPIRTDSMRLSIFADWVHTDDKISVSCTYCGYQSAVFSISGDGAMVGLESERCIRTRFNGATLSFDCKAGFIFLDDTEGWDAEIGLRYSVPLGCGRWGYAKGGYRIIDIKRAESRFIFEHAIEGGFVEFGFIF